MKLTEELIDDYLSGSLGKVQASELKLWLKSHPADAAKMVRRQALARALAEAVPTLSAARSKALWIGIKNRVATQQAAAPVIMLGGSDPWYAFIFKPWGGAGLATAGLAVAVMVWHPWNVPTVSDSVTNVEMKKDAAPVAVVSSAKRSKSEAPMAMAAMAPAPAVAADLASEPTEVERALADSGVDGMIDAYLAAQTSRRSDSTLRGGAGSSALAGFSKSMAMDESAQPVGLSAVHGGQDHDGFWNWKPAAMALNQRDWGQAKLELMAARLKAAESSERAFAASALTLLSAPGAPLDGQTDALPGTGELRVLGAGRWQLVLDSRLAQFSQGVSTRLPGFRAEGDSLLLDLTFDRGTFSPGTRFTRLAGEAPAEVLDARGQAVVSDEFNAPAGATYNVSGRQLKLR